MVKISMNKAAQLLKLQADATLSQANPVSGTKYTILDTTPNARVLGIDVKVTWTVQPTPLEIHLTIDGQTKTVSFTNPVSAGVYRILKYADPTTKYILIVTAQVSHGFIFEGRSVKVEMETTGGTVSNITGQVWYSKIP